MATNDTDLSIKISATDEASPTIKAALDNLRGSIEQLNQIQLRAIEGTKQQADTHDELNPKLVNTAAAISILKDAVHLAVSAYQALSAHLHKAVDEALESEKVQTRLAGALKTTGQFSQHAEEKIEAYVESLERFNGANGETVKGMIATGVQMGLTVKRSAEMEEAARKLAAATGKDVNEAFSILQKSLSGQGRALALLYPQMKDFGSAQLQSGVAIDFLNKKLSEQYEAYQKTLPAALARAEVALNNVYKSVGLIITQSSFVRAAVNLFTDGLVELERNIKVLDIWLTKNKDSIKNFAVAFLEATAIVGAGIVGYLTYTAVLAAMTAGATLSTIAVGALGVAMAVLTSPITLTIAAIGALTVAFYKWDEISNILVGSVKVVGASLFMLVSGPMLLAIEAAGKLAGLFDEELGKSLTDFSTKIQDQQKAWLSAGASQVEYGAKSLVTSKQAGDSFSEISKSVDSAKKAHLDLNTTVNETSKIYAGIDIGTDSLRKQLKGEAQDRDQAKKEFEEHLSTKNRLAVSYAQEQQTTKAKFEADQARSKADSLQGAGHAGAQAEAKAVIAAENFKQQQLKEKRQIGLIDEQEYHSGLLKIRQTAQQADLNHTLAKEQAKADLLGESPEGYQLKQQIQAERFKLELQQKEERAQLELASTDEINAMKLEAEAVFQQSQRDQLEAHYNEVANREEVSGATIQATRDKYLMGQQKAQADSMKNLMSGVSAMIAFQQAGAASLNAIGDAIIKGQKMTANKAAGIFLEAFGRQVMQKGIGDMLMAIFPPNPALMAAGAAQMAGGIAIGRVGANMQKGGAAHGGIDEIPASMDNSTFLLKAGERVVQPEANKELTQAVDKINKGDSSKSVTVNVTIHGSPSTDQVSQLKSAIIDAIRDASERGTPIINAKGVVYG